MTSSAAPAAPPAGKPRKPRYPATITHVEHLTQRMIQITFSNPKLAKFGWNGPATHIKLIFGDVNTALAPQPNAPHPTMHTYTPRRFDRETRELDVDFVLHGEGPASTWASQTAVDQQLTITKPKRNYVINPSITHYMLLNDDSAIPTISTILEHLPTSTETHVFLKIIDADEELPISARSHVNIHWLHHKKNVSKTGTLLESTARELDLTGKPYHMYITCKTSTMQQIRRHLLTEHRLNRDHIVTRGYWKLGATDHPNKDYKQDM